MAFLLNIEELEIWAYLFRIEYPSYFIEREIRDDYNRLGNGFGFDCEIWNLGEWTTRNGITIDPLRSGFAEYIIERLRRGRVLYITDNPIRPVVRRRTDKYRGPGIISGNFIFDGDEHNLTVRAVRQKAVTMRPPVSMAVRRPVSGSVDAAANRQERNEKQKHRFEFSPEAEGNGSLPINLPARLLITAPDGRALIHASGVQFDVIAQTQSSIVRLDAGQLPQAYIVLPNNWEAYAELKDNGHLADGILPLEKTGDYIADDGVVVHQVKVPLKTATFILTRTNIRNRTTIGQLTLKEDADKKWRILENGGPDSSSKGDSRIPQGGPYTLTHYKSARSSSPYQDEWQISGISGRVSIFHTAVDGAVASSGGLCPGQWSDEPVIAGEGSATAYTVSDSDSAKDELYKILCESAVANIEIKNDIENPYVFILDRIKENEQSTLGVLYLKGHKDDVVAEDVDGKYVMKKWHVLEPAGPDFADKDRQQNMLRIPSTDGTVLENYTESYRLTKYGNQSSPRKWSVRLNDICEVQRDGTAIPDNITRKNVVIGEYGGLKEGHMDSNHTRFLLWISRFHNNETELYDDSHDIFQLTEDTGKTAIEAFYKLIDQALKEDFNPELMINNPVSSIWATEDSKKTGGYLKVKKGQLTFDSEGKEHYFNGRTKLNFSRLPKVLTKTNTGSSKLAGISGVTIGRGYDVGQHDSEAVKTILQGIGVSSGRYYDFVMGAVGIKRKYRRRNEAGVVIMLDPPDEAPEQYMKNAIAGYVADTTRPYKVKDLMMNRKQQYDLFNILYPEYEDIVKNKMDVWIETNLFALDKRIADVLTDMQYRGDLDDKDKFLATLSLSVKSNAVADFKSALRNYSQPESRLKEREEYLDV